MPIHWEDYKFLIVDDIDEFCLTLKGMLRLCNAQDIDIARDGFEAIKKIKAKPYDLILCDYKLTEGKDGLQVLEQIRHEKLLKSSAVFIIISSVGGSELVMAAMEFQPDDYIMKPFNQAMLQQRLERTFRRRLDLSPIYYAIDQGHFDQAIALSEQIQKLQPKYAKLCEQIKSDIFFERKDYKNAKKIYEAQLVERMIPWAAFGLARACIAEGDLIKAEETLKQVILESPVFLKAYDLLAQVEFELKNYPEAKFFLKKALELSPRACVRQANLGKMAYENGDFDVAESAFREAVKLGRNSLNKNSENYIKFAKSLYQQINKPLEEKDEKPISKKQKEKNEQEKVKKGEELFGTLKELRQEFKNEKEAILDATLLAGKTYAKFSRMQEARSAIDAAYSAFQQIKNDCSTEMKVNMVESLMAVGEKKEAQNLAQSLISAGDDDLNLSLESVFEESDYNAKGIDAYQRKQYKEAIEAFELALKQNSDSVSFNLNYIQSILHFLKNNPDEPRMTSLSKAKDAFERIGKMPASDSRFMRFSELKEMFLEIEKGK